MPSVWDVWSNRIFLRACVEANQPPWSTKLTMKTAIASEWSDEFITLMRNRCTVGICRYGPILEDPLSFIGRLKTKLIEYERTGNMDLLPDMANYAMFEYVVPQNPKAFWPDQWEREENL